MASIFRACPEPAQLRPRMTGPAGALRVWGPVLFACIIIAIESTNTFSSEHTSGWIRPWIEHFVGHINDNVWAVGHFFARKTGHFIGYGTVCLTFLRAWLLTLAARDVRAWWRWKSVGLALLGTATVASLDEWHQTTIPSRTGTPVDVGIDTVGGSFVCLLIWFFFWRTRRMRERAESLPEPEAVASHS